MESDKSEYARLLRAERTLVIVRSVAVVFGFIQVITFYRPYPDHALALAFAVVGTMAIGNLVLYIRLARPMTQEQLHRVSVSSLTFDLLVAEAFVWAYTFDPETAIWAVLYILPLGGAIRFQRRGAMLVTTAASVIYASREVFGYYHYGNEFLIASISFRMGIAFIIAYVAGTTTRDLLNERRELEHANRELSDVNQSMRDFVSIASHDMRTPLSVISGLSQTLANDTGTMDAGQKSELIAVIHRRAQSLDRLVNDLLTTSNIEAGIVIHHPERLLVSAAVNDAIAMTDFSDATVEMSGETYVLADAEHVRRILVNFMSNAKRYGEPPFTVRVTKQLDTIDIRVSDCGPGVPTSFVPRLFERFARAPGEWDRSEGTGLGLAIVKGLAEVNNGTVAYEPNRPSGATFRLTLVDAESYT